MGVLYALLAVLLFIVSHSQVKVLGHYSVPQVVFIRAFGILCLSLPALFFLRVSPLGKDKKNLFLRGIFGSVAIFCYFTTLQNLPLSTAVVIQQLTPLFAVLIASFFLKELSSFKVYVLFMLAFVGIYLVKEPDADWSWYYLVGLVSSFFAAMAYNYIRKLKDTDHPFVVLTYFQYVLAPSALFFTLQTGVTRPAAKDFLPVLLLVLFSFFAQVFLTLAYQASRVSKASSLSFLSIPLSIVVGYIFFDETLSLSQFAGVSLIFTSVLLNLFYEDFRAFLAGFCFLKTGERRAKIKSKSTEPQTNEEAANK